MPKRCQSFCCGALQATESALNLISALGSGGCRPSASSVQAGASRKRRNDPASSPRDQGSIGGPPLSAPSFALPCVAAGDARFSHTGQPVPLRARCPESWSSWPLAMPPRQLLSPIRRSDRARRCDPGRRLCPPPQQSAGSATAAQPRPFSGPPYRSTDVTSRESRPPGAGSPREHEKGTTPCPARKAWIQPQPKPASAAGLLIPC